MDQGFLSAKRLAARIRRGDIGCLEALDHAIDRVERFDGALNAIVVRDFERARKRARALDRRKPDKPGPLYGVPATIKESFDIEGLPTTWGIPALRDHRADSNALAVERLQAAGAVLFGKTNVPINLADWQSFNAIYGTTNNPWDMTRSPGGSSGGAAAALAAGLTHFETGSDIGSSIRNPAHYCGLFGHKTTWGICPQRGHTIFGNVTEVDIGVIGPLARSAEDLDIGLSVLAGAEDPEAGFEVRLPKPRREGFKGLRVAVMTSHPLSDVDEGMQATLHDLAKFLGKQGAKVSLTARPEFDLARAHELYITLLRSITSTGLTDAQEAHWRAEAARLGAEDKSYYAMMARGYAMSHRAFLLGHEQRERMRRAWGQFFREWDIFLCPPAATPAVPHDHTGERYQRTIEVNGKRVPVTDQMFWAGISCFFGLPGTVAPLGQSAEGLPFGVQIVGPQGGDRGTIHFARLMEKSWRAFVPPPGYA
jgi:amidase